MQMRSLKISFQRDHSPVVSIIITVLLSQYWPSCGLPWPSIGLSLLGLVHGSKVLHRRVRLLKSRICVRST